MKVVSSQFIKSIVDHDHIFEDGIPQVAFIGRSNVGKSSIINSLTNQGNLARTSSFPGRTQMINVFLINKALYFIDLPGYGYARVSHETRDNLASIIDWYFFTPGHNQKKVVLIIDAVVGPTKDDLEMLQKLVDFRKDIIVIANKIDKLKRKDYNSQINKIQQAVGSHRIIPLSTKEKTGINELLQEIL
ncbi:YihA family ribosome biogenesis GTP-binding protein [Candidatus Parcubacteria bacterium]|jgi:GTP-binding protein|nr:MAG: YihA family ribosome biogenesis GTP-binding protein [Candidatus Parcubacteria bacterium]